MFFNRKYGRRQIAVSAAVCILLSQDVQASEDVWTPRKVRETLSDWTGQYPNLIRVENAQDKYDVPTAGDAVDCPFDQGEGCKNYFFTIQDFVTHPEGSESSRYLPEVFWTASLHGDEKLAPSVVMEAAAMLMESATCEAMPGPDPTLLELGRAKACRQALADRGIDNTKRQWLARLASTRRIVVVPSANSLGFYSNTKLEGDFDPARDFPYEEKNCMRTAAARTVNEIFREHMFQVAVSFHSGEGVVGFSWRKQPEATPDKRSQLQLAKAFSSAVSGGFIYEEFRSPNDLFEDSTVLHDYVTENKQFEIKRHKGSFEDWAYAGSWDYTVNTCNPSMFGGYAVEKTQYTDSTNRALSLYTSIRDGVDQNKTDNSMKGNVRLALASVDMVQPYVNIFGVNNLALADDVVPLTRQASEACHSSKSVIASARDSTLTIEWTVGGGLYVDYTELKWAKNYKKSMDCLMQPTEEELSEFELSNTIEQPGGHGYFADNGAEPSPDGSTTRPGDIMGPIFRAHIDVSDLKAGDEITILALARLDQNWNFAHAEGDNSITPQSHLVHARTNPDWNHEHAGKIIKGRLNWYSVPIKILFDDYDDELGTLQLHDRFDPMLHVGGNKDDASDDNKSDMKMTDAPVQSPSASPELNQDQETGTSIMAKFWQFVLVVGSVFAVFVFTILHIQKRAALGKTQSVMQAEEEAEGGLRVGRATSGHRYADRPDPYVPRADEIVDFGNEGIYKKKGRRSDTPSPRSSGKNNREDLIDLDNLKPPVYDSEFGDAEYDESEYTDTGYVPPEEEFSEVRIV